MLMPFEWVVGDSSKDHTVTASMFYDVLATVRYTTLWGITIRITHSVENRDHRNTSRLTHRTPSRRHPEPEDERDLRRDLVAEVEELAASGHWQEQSGCPLLHSDFGGVLWGAIWLPPPTR